MGCGPPRQALWAVPIADFFVSASPNPGGTAKQVMSLRDSSVWPWAACPSTESETPSVDQALPKDACDGSVDALLHRRVEPRAGFGCQLHQTLVARVVRVERRQADPIEQRADL